jgi:hypothetical protein
MVFNTRTKREASGIDLGKEEEILRKTQGEGSVAAEINGLHDRK